MIPGSPGFQQVSQLVRLKKSLCSMASSMISSMSRKAFSTPHGAESDAEGVEKRFHGEMSLSSSVAPVKSERMRHSHWFAWGLSGVSR